MHGYSNIKEGNDFTIVRFNNKSEGMTGVLNPLLGNEEPKLHSVDEYTHAATGQAGNESRTLNPKHSIEEFTEVKVKLKRPPVRLSPSPVMGMPISSVGDGYYRGNSLGDARVMNWNKPVVPVKKLRSSLKTHI